MCKKKSALSKKINTIDREKWYIILMWFNADLSADLKVSNFGNVMEMKFGLKYENQPWAMTVSAQRLKKTNTSNTEIYV